MNWNPTAYPGGTSLKPIIIDLIWALTGHTIKDLLASLTILYCVGRLRHFRPQILGSDCFEMMHFLLSGTTLFLSANFEMRLF